MPKPNPGDLRVPVGIEYSSRQHPTDTYSAQPVGPATAEVVVVVGTKQLQAEEILEAIAVSWAAAVEVSMQLAAHDAVPVAAKISEGFAVQEPQKDCRLERLAVYC